METRFVEQINSTRFGLLQKFPMILSIGLTIYLGRKLTRVHNLLISHSQYIRIDTNAKKTYNSLTIVQLVFHMLNLASVFACSLLTGYQYIRCFKRRYLEPISFEDDLIQSYLPEIRKYRSVHWPDSQLCYFKRIQKSNSSFKSSSTAA